MTEQLEEGNLDVAVVTAPPRLSDRLKAVHRFSDSFVMIAADRFAGPRKQTAREIAKWSQDLPWILLHEETETGRLLRHWDGEPGLSNRSFEAAKVPGPQRAYFAAIFEAERGPEGGGVARALYRCRRGIDVGPA